MRYSIKSDMTQVCIRINLRLHSVSDLARRQKTLVRLFSHRCIFNSLWRLTMLSNRLRPLFICVLVLLTAIASLFGGNTAPAHAFGAISGVVWRDYNLTRLWPIWGQYA